jgi:thymidylate kinase
MFLYAISGVDGSGKSTFACEIVDRLCVEAPQLSVYRLWLRYIPRRGAASTVRSTVSANHRGHPVKRALRGVGLKSVWVTTNASLYRKQLRWQLAAVQATDVIIADRFVLDFLVDQVAAGMLHVNKVNAVAANLPNADVEIHLDADDQELLRRLKPGDDEDRVLRQATYYRQVASALGMPSLDSREPDAVRQAADSILASAE